MFQYNEITQRKYIVLDDEPYEVVSSHIFRKQQRKPVNQTKLKNLISGKVIEKSFHQQESVKEADIENKKIKYLYNNKGEVWFSEEDNPSQRFQLAEGLVDNQIKFMKENSIVDSVVFNEKIIGIKLPIKVELKVIDAPPAVKGNTAQGGTKQITLETGVIINAPMFINEGDSIKINTETGEYTERIAK